MSYVFIELCAPLQSWVEDSDALFPVRASQADALQAAEHPHPEGVLFELERYLAENPDKLPRYRKSGSQLAFRTAEELFTNGMREHSPQFYELSLRLNPDDLLTRKNYAVALHALGRRDAALQQYGEIMKRTTPKEDLRIWILAAQVHFHRGEYEEVVQLLRPVATDPAADTKEFWDLFGEARTELLRAEEAKQAKGLVCATCGTRMPTGMRFCGQCGAKLV
jgi:tetratricopeptide (TPR) repeat protein